MAEDEDGVSDKKSPQNSNNGASPQENEQNASKPDLGIEEAKYNANDNDDTSPTEAASSSSSECFTKLFFVINIEAFLSDRAFSLQSAAVRFAKSTTNSRSGTF